MKEKLICLILCTALSLSACTPRIEEVPGEVPPDNEEIAGDDEELDDDGFPFDWENSEEDEEPREPLEQPPIDAEMAKALLEPDEDGIIIMTAPFDLMALSALVNSGDEEHAQYTYRMAGRISLHGYDFIPIGGFDEEGNGFYFQGTFDGEDNLVTDLTIYENGFFRGTGLFGAIGLDGVVKNTHLIEGDVTGQFSTGGFAGHVQGSMENCSYRGKVYANAEDVGGLVGALGGGEAGEVARISRSFCNVEVFGMSSTGGFAGSIMPDSLVENCYALGAVNAIGGGSSAKTWNIGGFLGMNSNGSVSNCFSHVELYTRVAADIVGGFIGYNFGETRNCYYNEGVTSNWKTVGYSHQDVEHDVTGCTTEELCERETYAGWDFDTIWDIDGSSNRGLPFLP